LTNCFENDLIMSAGYALVILSACACCIFILAQTACARVVIYRRLIPRSELMTLRCGMEKSLSLAHANGGFNGESGGQFFVCALD
jgi:hypothetical protein